ncbi:MAG TPA: NrfD/PsrC family molybdoenzyme membrane anchor subunit [Candidatus Dormibacteraeota bacterium]|nr:NrfD/PsrC family molybdoenzyme membrane anchor subunit [Candidatus Dormibacteraeota bacterium]
MSGAAPAGRTYYGQPVVSAPVWRPSVALYFFVGGLAGASAVLGAAARLSGNPRLARSCVLAAAGAAAACPPLLIEDLGRPERFLHMLRMLRVTSPMSVGTWVLTAFGAASGAAALSEVTGRLRPLGRAGQAASALLGLPLTTYTAVLVATTSMPAWRRARLHLPPLFAATAAASAGALAVLTTPRRDAAAGDRLAAGGAVVAAAVERLMERHLGDDARAYDTWPARLAAPALVAGATAILAAPRSRVLPRLGAGLILAGGLAERFAVYRAGRESARRTLA